MISNLHQTHIYMYKIYNKIASVEINVNTYNMFIPPNMLCISMRPLSWSENRFSYFSIDIVVFFFGFPYTFWSTFNVKYVFQQYSLSMTQYQFMYFAWQPHMSSMSRDKGCVNIMCRWCQHIFKTWMLFKILPAWIMFMIYLLLKTLLNEKDNGAVPIKDF